MSDAFQAELTKSSPWLVHASRRPYFESIQALGLKRSNPWDAEGALTYTGDESRNFICLKPALSPTDTTPIRPEDYFFLAGHDLYKCLERIRSATSSEHSNTVLGSKANTSYTTSSANISTNDQRHAPKIPATIATVPDE